MIGRIRGTLVEKHPPKLLLDVNGVGYELEAPMTTFYKLPDIDAELGLHTHLIVREDAHLLFGFSTETERSLFRRLIKVNGVGAKLALAILSGCDFDEFVNCVRNGDAARLTRLPGVGKKIAERLVIEMRDRLSDWGREASPQGVNTIPDPGERSDVIADAIAGLVALGYKPQEASRNVRAVANPDLSTEAIIRLALKTAL